MNILPTNTQPQNPATVRFNNSGNAAAGRNKAGDPGQNAVASNNTGGVSGSNDRGNNGGGNPDPIRWAIKNEKDLIESSRHDVYNLSKIYHLDAGAQRALTGVRKEYNEAIRQATMSFIKGGATDRAAYDSALADARKAYESGILGVTRGDNDGQRSVGDGVGAPDATGNAAAQFAGAQGAAGASFDDFG